MHIIQMAQEQHAIYFGYAFFSRSGKFDRNRNVLIIFIFIFYYFKANKTLSSYTVALHSHEYINN